MGLGARSQKRNRLIDVSLWCAIAGIVPPIFISYLHFNLTDDRTFGLFREQLGSHLVVYAGGLAWLNVIRSRPDALVSPPAALSSKYLLDYLLFGAQLIVAIACGYSFTTIRWIPVHIALSLLILSVGISGYSRWRSNYGG